MQITVYTSTTVMPGAINIYYTMDDAGALTETHRVPAWQDERGSTQYLALAAAPAEAATKGQVAALAQRYLMPALQAAGAGVVKPNNDLCRWAFAGLGGPQGVSAKYGDGSKVYLAGRS